MTDTVTYQKPKTRDLDIQNFDQIVADNESKIFNTIYSFVGNRDDALDLTQETFICAYRSLGKFRYESSISTWLYRIAINLCKKSHSKKKRYALVFSGSLDDPDLELQVDNRDSGEISAVEVLEINEEDTPLGICTSSGTVGHSLSYGKADAIIVLSSSTTLADAAATAIGNLIKQPGDIPNGLEFAKDIDGLMGVIIIKDDKLGLWGDVKICQMSD